MVSDSELLQRKIAAYRLLQSAERRYHQVQRASFAAMDSGDDARAVRIDAIRLRILERMAARRAAFYAEVR